MLAAAMRLIAPKLIGLVAGPIVDVVKLFIQKKIDMAQLQTQLAGILIDNVTKVEVANADALTKTYQTFMSAAQQTPGMLYAWCAVLYSQLFVLLWHQFFLPFIVFMQWAPTGSAWRSDTTADWGYLLVAGCIGLAPAVFRGGGTGSGWLDSLRALVLRR